MSSCKLWRDKRVGRRCDNGCNSSRKTPALLRLDSTGEGSSFDSTSGQNSKMCQGKNSHFCTCHRQQGEKLSVQSVWNGFSMSSMLDTANSYLSTASSYLESFYPATSKCLLDHRYPNNSKDPIVLCDRTMSTSVCDENGAWPQSSKRRAQVLCEEKKPWTQEILGALHSTVFNKDTSQNSHPKADRYIPPPLRHRYLREKHGHVVNTDPSITRHTTHLLEKSKHRYTYPNNHAGSCKISEKNSDADTCQPNNVEKESEAIHFNLPLKSRTGNNLPHKNDVQKTSTNKYTKDLSGPVIDQAEDDLKTVNNNSDSAYTDWFEYENKCEITIPLQVRELSFGKSYVNDKVEESVIDQPCEERQKMLHSWYSMDNDTEVKKVDTAPNISSSSTPSQAVCDNDEDSVLLESGNKWSVTSEVNQEMICAESKTSCKVEPDHKSKNDGCTKQHVDNDRKNELVSVLYVRNCTSSKRRPSAHKRSRHKAQKSSNTLDKANNKTSKSLKDGNAVHPNSSIAFILGVDCDQADNRLPMQSFQINCDIDDLDWSSCDETDDTVDSIDCDDFDLCQALSLVNFQVTCSVPSASTSILNPSLIDKINLEWEINISIEPEKQKKPQSSKKVHFKNDESLATVHPMIAWSYAYQAARKGPWEEIARDRGRFLRRITDGEKLLKPVFESSHRSRIFTERFESSAH